MLWAKYYDIAVIVDQCFDENSIKVFFYKMYWLYELNPIFKLSQYLKPLWGKLSSTALVSVNIKNFEKVHVLDHDIQMFWACTIF